MDYSLNNLTAEQCDKMAEEAALRSRESFERSDTDGFVTQWCNDLSARKYSEQARIKRNGGKAFFYGLYQGDRRVKARMVSRPAFNAPWKTVLVWELHSDEQGSFGRRYIPAGQRSRVQKTLGLSERGENAPAEAYIGGSGRGMSGLASCFVSARRTGDQWGQDSVLAEDSE